MPSPPPLVAAETHRIAVGVIRRVRFARCFLPDGWVNRWEERISRCDMGVDVRDQQGIGQRQREAVNFRAADDEDFVAARAGDGRCQIGAGLRIGQGERGIAADDQILPPRQGAADTVVGFAPHDDRMAEGLRLEVFQVARQMPRHGALVADGAVVALRDDEEDFRHAHSTATFTVCGLSTARSCGRMMT